MGISPIHDTRQTNGRIDATMKALKSTKRRQEIGRAAKQELSNAKKNFTENFSCRPFLAKFSKLFLMIAFYFASSIALTFYQKQLIMVRLLKGIFTKLHFGLPPCFLVLEHHCPNLLNFRTWDNSSQDILSMTSNPTQRIFYNKKIKSNDKYYAANP